MRQLWLSSPELGICTPNLGRFKSGNNLAKIENLETSFERSPLWAFAVQILVPEFQSQLMYYFLKCAHFGPCYLIWDVLAILYQLLHNFHSIY